MSEVIPLTSDIVFKYVMGAEGSASRLRAFLSAVQEDAGYPALKEVSIQNPYNLKQSLTDKTSIIDVRALDTEGHQYNVEVQAQTQKAFRERTLYYWARSYAEQLEEGQPYIHLHRVVGVSILAFTLFPEIPRAHTSYLLREREDPNWVLTEHCMLHYLELPKVHQALNDPLSRWLYYLKNGPTEDDTVKVLLNEDHDIRDTHERYRHFVADDEARAAYEARKKFLHDQASREQTAREEGREEGIEVGIEKGREEGREEGERRRAEAIAARLKASGMDVKQISELTGLGVDEVAEL